MKLVAASRLPLLFLIATQNDFLTAVIVVVDFCSHIYPKGELTDRPNFDTLANQLPSSQLNGTSQVQLYSVRDSLFSLYVLPLGSFVTS